MRRALPIGLAAVLLLGMAAPAQAELAQVGDVIGSFDAELNPSALPRERPSPVAVQVSGSFHDADGGLDQLPQLRRIDVAINRGGHLFDRGVPICRARQIQPSPERAARRICGDSIVGRGHVHVQVRIPDQMPYMVRAPVLAFNGPVRNGHRLILAQAYVKEPVTSFVISFEVRHKPGLFGTVLSTVLPRTARRWAWLTHFDLSLHRTFSYRGQRRSYVSAACAAPAGLLSASFPFARAAYSFAGGRRLHIETTRSCRVSE